MDGSPPLIYTIGHSDHTTGGLIHLLQRHAMDAVVDVRSQPYSHWAPQFNREILSHQLRDAGIAYRFMVRPHALGPDGCAEPGST